MRALVPTVGALVVQRGRPGTMGQVRALGEPGSSRVRVYWPKSNTNGWYDLSDITNGFRPGMEVLHQPRSAVVTSLGWGTVRAMRTVAGVTQLLVEFAETGIRRWLPWQTLRFVRGVRHRFHAGPFEGGDAAERQRLRLLAWAIRLWNENTGALATFDIDPLPHQINLVHHILASGQYNWLIADDVGLGKTIEVGLLLSALRERGEARRVLLITPAGLTRQWQEEMAGRFGLEWFRIYGDDFVISEPRHWKMYDYVIGSMDRFKAEPALTTLLQAEPWDLVIVDEAHRLSRRQYGMKFDSSQRYDLVKALRSRTESLILLTATPHQGKEDSFIGLLELLHPDRRSEFLTLSMNPEIIGEMVFRNYKADVTDIDGNFLFYGKTVRDIEVPASPEAAAFDDRLRHYLRRGYAAGNEDGGATGRAIGFVMTVYRKLAASSIAAIHSALVCRRERLLREVETSGSYEDDERFQGEIEERSAGETPAREFFEGEVELLNGLIAEAERLKRCDTKISSFMGSLIESILKDRSREKVLVFTEYRTTQEWIRDALVGRYGDGSTVLIHGGMNMTERRQAISRFDEDQRTQFLVSTEAGGEGINLHSHCHIMVNYDLPWNPMRLVQRVGRLYRYGQKKRVVVFNIHQSQTADEHVLSVMYRRLEKVAEDMAVVQAREYNDAMKEDIIGELADLMDVEEVLVSAAQQGISRTEERIEAALEVAKQAARKQQELFKHAAGFDPNETRGELVITPEHLRSFVSGMCASLGIDVLERTHGGMVWHLRLPERVVKFAGVTRSRWVISFDRLISSRRPDALHMGAGNWLLELLLREATHYDFGGVTAVSRGMRSQWIVAAICRWQNEHGRRGRQQLAVVGLEGEATTVNSAWVSDWMCEPQPQAASATPRLAVAEEVLRRAEHCIEGFLAERCGQTLFPDEPQWLTAAVSDQPAS